MKKLLLLLVLPFCINQSLAQPVGLIGETFNLESIEDPTSYTPNGENSTITFTENGIITFEAFGIENTISGDAVFNGDAVTLKNMTVTSQTCTGNNCYFESAFFYEILTNTSLADKTFTFYYNLRNDGFKYLTLIDSANNYGSFSNKPLPIPNPLLFQTWYLYQQDADLGDSVYFTGPNPPQITINPDFTYSGLDGCTIISGDFILANSYEYYDFILQSQNYEQDTSNCPSGTIEYNLYVLQYDYPIFSGISTDSQGIDYFYYEISPGFTSHFKNVLILSTPENSKISFSLYPNPTSEKLSIKTSEKILNVNIMDVTGKLVASESSLEKDEIDVSSLKSGIYFITITSSEGNITKKFIKK